MNIQHFLYKSAAPSNKYVTLIKIAGFEIHVPLFAMLYDVIISSDADDMVLKKYFRFKANISDYFKNNSFLSNYCASNFLILISMKTKAFAGVPYPFYIQKRENNASKSEIAGFSIIFIQDF